MPLHNDALLLLAAMIDCHRRHLNGSYTEEGPIVPGYTGQEIAEKFAVAAQQSLSSRDLNILKAFFQDLPTSVPDSVPIQNLPAKKQRFVAAEQVASGRDDTYLATGLSGPLDAKLGVVLHHPTRDLGIHWMSGPVKDFWEETENSSIDALLTKGFTPARNFGTDALQRAAHTRDKSFSEGACAQRAWNDLTKTLHHDIFSDIMNDIHSPLLVVGGQCPWKHYKAHLRKNSDQILQLEFNMPERQILRFAISLKNGSVQRFAVSVHHPAAAYYHAASEWQGISLQQDAGCNLMFWLIAQSHEPSGFSGSNRYDATQRRPNPSQFQTGEEREPTEWLNSAEYCRRERVCYRQSGTLLGLDEYEPSFIKWAEGYLEESAESIIASGKPLAECVKRKSHPLTKDYLIQGRNRPANKPSLSPKGPRNQTKFKWTLEADESLMELKSIGFTASQIANELSQQFGHKFRESGIHQRYIHNKKNGIKGDSGPKDKIENAPVQLDERDRLLIKLRDEENLAWPEVTEKACAFLGRELQVGTIQHYFKHAIRKENLWKTLFEDNSVPATTDKIGVSQIRVEVPSLATVRKREKSLEEPHHEQSTSIQSKKNPKRLHHWPKHQIGILTDLKEKQSLSWSQIEEEFNRKTNLNFSSTQLKAYYSVMVSRSRKRKLAETT